MKTQEPVDSINFFKGMETMLVMKLKKAMSEPEALENFIWKGLHELGIAPRNLVVEGQEIRIEVTRAKEIRLPAKALCAGVSELSRVGSRRNLIKDWSLDRQLGHLVWKGRRA